MLTQEEEAQLYKFLQPKGAGAIGPDVTRVTPENVPQETITAKDTHLTPDSNDSGDSRIVDSHPGTTPDELTPYIKEQEAQVDKFGPDQQKSVLDDIQKEQNSLGTTVGRMGTGFADAIMQGVARAGNPGFQRQFDENLANKEKMRAEAIPQLQGMNEKNMGAKQALESMSSKTPLGSSQTPVLAGVLSMMGVPPDKAQKMLQNPAAARAALQPFADVFGAKMKAQLEAEFKRLELALQGQNMALTHADKAQQQKTDEEKKRLEAAKTYGDRGLWRRAVDFATQNPATKVLKEEMIAPDVKSYAEKHGITVEEAQAIKDKRTGSQ